MCRIEREGARQDAGFPLFFMPPASRLSRVIIANLLRAYAAPAPLPGKALFCKSAAAFRQSVLFLYFLPKKQYNENIKDDVVAAGRGTISR